MKSKLSPFYLLSFVFYLLALHPLPSALSQVPQGFNYQAVLRDDPSNNPIVSQGVQIRFTIQTAGSVVIYQETHSTTTDEFGAISLVVGGGTPVGAYVFSNIDWSVPLSLKTEFEYPVSGTPDYDKLMGTTALKSVPYALVADGFTQPVEKLGITGTTTNDEEALFEVKNNGGQTVFAVYNEGVRIYVKDQDAKGPKGGFAIGGFGMGKTIPHQYMYISGDSVRFNIDNGDDDKASKGGFAIGGFGTVKGLTQKYLMVSNDSVRIYIDSKDTDKGPKGGFAIGGYGTAKGKPQDLLTVSNDSVRIYIDNAGEDKGPKGGFAIGGYGLVKGQPINYLRVSEDSTRIYVSDVTKTGSLGGFAVKPVAAASENTDFFNVTSAPAAEVIKNESRIMWYPVKSALIGGEVHVGSADSVGQNSTALGYRSIAKGNQSQAFGYRSLAYGSYSTAIGYKAESNNNAMAVGYQAKASGNDAFAFGSGALAIADKSFAFGSVGRDSLGTVTGNTKAVGDYSYAFGLGAVATGRGAFAIGANDTASGNFSTSLGYKTKADGWYATAMGSYSKAISSYSTAMGYKSKASAVASFAGGYISEAKGDQSLSMGYQTKSIGAYSIAMGGSTTAQGAFSFAVNNTTFSGGLGSSAFGGNTNAAGQYAMATGQLTSASGWYSFAGGDGNTSSGQASLCVGKSNSSAGYYSLVTGIGNTAKSINCVTIGSYCSDPGTDPDTFVASDPLFIAGNGYLPFQPSRNALILYKNGNMTIMGTLTETSDIRFKNVISELGSVLPEVLEITPILFEFKDPMLQSGTAHIGFSAQEVRKYFPELVFTDHDGYLSLDYSRLSVVLVKAVQEQQALIEQERSRNDYLEDQIREINLKLEQLAAKKAGE